MTTNLLRTTAGLPRWLFGFALIGLLAIILTAQAAPAPELSLDLRIGQTGQVRAVVRDSQGRTIIGGMFSQVDGVPRSNLARLNADGSLDTSFAADADNVVFALAVASDGTLYVGGQFGVIGGVARSRIARISSAGVVDPAFPADTPTGATVRSLQLDEANATLYFGGNFASMVPTSRARLAKVSTATGLLDANFNFNIPSGNVVSLALDGSAGLFLGGNFTSVSSQSRVYLARVFIDGTSGTLGVDTAFNAGITPGAGLAVTGVAVNATHVFAGGNFTAPAARLGKFDRGSGAVDAAWNPVPNSTVRALSIGPSDALLVGGDFTLIGATPRSRLAWVSQSGTGAVDAGWAPTSNSSVFATQSTASSLLVGGLFSDIGGTLRAAVAELPLVAAPTPVPAFDALVTTPGGATNSYLHADGSLWIGGDFLTVSGQPRSRLARILPNGTLDAGFDLPVSGTVYWIGGDGAGRVYAAGRFGTAGGQSRNSILRLTTNRLLDTSFLAGVTNLGLPGSIFDAAISSDALFVAGNIDNAGDVGSPGTARTVLAKFDLTTGALDPAWSPVPAGAVNQSPVQTIALDAGNDALYIGGGFQTVNGQAHVRLARLTASTGVLDAAFTPSVDGTGDVWGLAVDPLTQHLYVGGFYASINATVGFESLARISTLTGTLDASFDAGLTAADQVEDVLFDTPTTVCIAGFGASFGNLARYYRQGAVVRDVAFAPAPNNYVADLQYRASDQTLIAAGLFTMAGVDVRDGLAAFKVEAAMFRDGFE